MMIIHINGNLSENHAKNYVDFDILRHNPFESRTIRINLLAKKNKQEHDLFLLLSKLIRVHPSHTQVNRL